MTHGFCCGFITFDPTIRATDCITSQGWIVNAVAVRHTKWCDMPIPKNLNLLDFSGMQFNISHMWQVGFLSCCLMGDANPKITCDSHPKDTCAMPMRWQVAHNITYIFWLHIPGPKSVFLFLSIDFPISAFLKCGPNTGCSSKAPLQARVRYHVWVSFIQTSPITHTSHRGALLQSWWVAISGFFCILAMAAQS